MRRILWIGARQKFNVALFCSLQIVIILYKLIDTVEPRPQEMQITVANPNKHIKDGRAKELPKMVPIEDIETWYNGGDDFM